MEIQHLRDHFEDELDFPTDLETVLEVVGETEIEAPDRDDSMTIANILGHLDEGSYETASALRKTIVTNVPSEYVGRENYSDRGPEGNQPAADDAREEEQESL
jgi:hypothetical protein